MIESIYQRIVFPAFETLWKRRGTMRFWRELEQTQWASREELDRLQFAGLQRLLRHAYDHCPFYSAEWKERGLDPSAVKSLEDFKSWPVIGRDEILTHRMNMRARVPGMRLYSKSTGGSSGVPLHFDLDWEANDRRSAAWHRGYSWAGAAPGTKQLYVWGVALGDVPSWKRWKDYLYTRMLFRRYVLNTFDLREETIPEFFQAHNRYRPDVIVGYTNPLYQFARSLEERQWRPFSPKSIVVGAEKLHDFQRELIERVFEAPVFETYGSREFTLIGAECEKHEGLHLTHENLLVEILDDEGKPTPAGEEGNIVVTDLTNHGMPFVRYANGDRAVSGWKDCSCGRGLPLLQKVIGRQLDILHTIDGRHIPGEFFPHLVKDYPAIKRFQVIQESADEMSLKIVTDDSWNASDEAHLRTTIEATMGATMKLSIQRVADIPLTPAGKLQVVVNRSSHPVPLKV